MARIARIFVPGFPHHVTQRGNRRQKTFFSDSDYAHYLALLRRFSASTGTAVWAYCLMPNHVHLILVPSTEYGLRTTLAEVHRRYTRAVNLRENWRGHLWQERFHSVVMDEPYTLAAARYVELNPLRAGLSGAPENWPWSSASAHLQRRSDGIVSLRPLLDWIPDWRALLATDDKPLERGHLQKHTRTGRPLGGSAFLTQIERITGVCPTPRKAGRSPQLECPNTSGRPRSTPPENQ